MAEIKIQKMGYLEDTGQNLNEKIGFHIFRDHSFRM